MLIVALCLVATAVSFSSVRPASAAGPPTFVQAETFGTGTRVLSTTATLTSAVNQGDLLVGWFSQFDAEVPVRVSDNVNGAWTRAAGGLAFQNDSGDLALYYRENTQAAGASALTVTVSVAQAAFLQGGLAEYSGIAVAGSLDQAVFGRDIGTAVDTGPTPSVDAGEFVYSAIVTGGLPGTITPGTSQGQTYTARTATTGSSYEQDIIASAAGAQNGTATLANSTDWYAVVAVFHPVPTGATQPPTTPGGLTVTSNATSRVAVAWSPSSGSVAGYTIYRNGAAVGTAGPARTSFLDTGVAASTSYTYAVDAFNLAGEHSARSPGAAVTTPPSAPTFVQGGGMSPGTRLASQTLTLAAPVSAGDLLVGWFAQFNTAGQVQVSDNVNGPWTRSVSEGFSSGTGDIALFYTRSAAAGASGLTVTVTDPAGLAFLQFAMADFRGVPPLWTLDQAVVSEATTGTPAVGPTGSVPAGELVVASVLTGGQPGWTAPGDSQRVPYSLDAHNGSTSADLEDILSSAAGPQQAGFTLGRGSDWYMMIATFGPPRTALTTVSPTRIMDTRTGLGVNKGQMQAGETRTLQVTGQNGVPSGASAIVVNVGVTDTQGAGSGYVLVYPCGTPQPLASTANWLNGQTIASLTQVALGSGGCLNVFNAAGQADVFLDLQGYFTGATAGTTAGLYNPLNTPYRALDTRIGLNAPQARLGAGGTVLLQVAGNSNLQTSPAIPATAAAVVLNLTEVNGSSFSYLSAYPSQGGSNPCPADLTSSNLNFPPSRVLANRVTVKVGASGGVCFYNSQGSVDILGDLTGWYSGGQGADTTGLAFSPMVPTRLYDSRAFTPSRPLSGSPSGSCPNGNDVTITIPPAITGAVSMTVTVLSADSGSYLEVYPNGNAPSPPTSDINFRPGDILPNLAVTKVGVGSGVNVCNAVGHTQFFIDVNGGYS